MISHLLSCFTLDGLTATTTLLFVQSLSGNESTLHETVEGCYSASGAKGSDPRYSRLKDQFKNIHDASLFFVSRDHVVNLSAGDSADTLTLAFQTQSLGNLERGLEHYFQALSLRGVQYTFEPEKKTVRIEVPPRKVVRGASVYEVVDDGNSESHRQKIRIVSKFIYRELSDGGFDAKDIIAGATELLGLATETIRKESSEMRTRLHAALDIELDTLSQSVRLSDCLQSANIFWVGQLVQRTENDMLKVKRMTKKPIKELKAILTDLSAKTGVTLSLGMLPEQLHGWRPPRDRI